MITIGQMQHLEFISIRGELLLNPKYAGQMPRIIIRFIARQKLQQSRLQASNYKRNNATIQQKTADAYGEVVIIKTGPNEIPLGMPTTWNLICTYCILGFSTKI